MSPELYSFHHKVCIKDSLTGIKKNVFINIEMKTAGKK